MSATITAVMVNAGDAAESLAAAVRSADAEQSLVVISADDNIADLAATLAAWSVPYRAHGAALFSAHPRARQYVEALAALADRDDGGAEAALMRPPFFALEPADIIVALVQKDATDRRRQRSSAAREIVQELRRQRHHVPPLQTARALIDRTACGSVLAKEPNGAQELATLQAIASWLEMLAWRDDLDFDAAVDRLRCDLKTLAATSSIEISPGIAQLLPASTAATLACETGITWPACTRAQMDAQWTTAKNADGSLELQQAGAPLRLCIERCLIFLQSAD
jgi:ATP-dependent helicase/nuclease subunit A